MHKRPAASSPHNGSARVILAPTLLGLLALAVILGAALLGGCGSKGTGSVSKGSVPVATTWTKQYSGQDSGTSEYLESVTFTDPSHGWAVGGSKDISTHAWSSIILAATAGD